MNSIQNERHGHTTAYRASPTYKSWSMARYRCKSKYPAHLKNYGNKGIRFSSKWNKFKAFLADMGERPDGTTLDRIDPMGNYEPGNCRWATLKAQGRNRTVNVQLTLNDETYCMAEWAERRGISYDTLKWRVQNGWSDEDALMKPVRPAAKRSPVP